jgi:hypothetical protein
MELQIKAKVKLLENFLEQKNKKKTDNVFSYPQT